MAGEVSIVRVGDVAASISETHPRTKPQLIFLNTSDVLSGKLLHSDYSSVANWPGQAKKSIKQGDILFSEIRPANRRYAFVDRPADDFVVSTKLMVIRADPRRVRPRFLYHFLTQTGVTGRLQHLAESRSGTFPQITFDQIAELDIPLPPLGTQEAIAEFADALEQKIEVNRKMNETLEAMARALFKSWFADFDPVRAKAEGRDPGLPAAIADLFPDSFEASEVGPIPEGWRAVRIEDVSERIAMGPFGSFIKVETFVETGVPVISGQHLCGFMLEDSVFNFISEEHAQRLARAEVRRGDVVFTHAGRIGQAAFIPEESKYDRYLVSQCQFFMRCNRSLISPSFIAFYFGTDVGRHKLLANTSSSGVPSIARPITHLRSIVIPLPPITILSEFERLAAPQLSRYRTNQGNHASLTGTRDALLPKLISGELRLKAAEQLVEAAV